MPGKSKRPVGGGNPAPEREHRPRFILTVVLYGALVLVLSVLLLSDLVFEDLMSGLRSAVARGAAQALATLGMPVTARGQLISGAGTSLLIVNECTGVDATILLVSAVLVFPAGLRQKLIGTLLCAAMMLALNFVRVLTLVYIGNYHGAWLDVSHLYVWPVVVILAGVGTLLFWAERFAVPRAI